MNDFEEKKFECWTSKKDYADNEWWEFAEDELMTDTMLQFWVVTAIRNP